jgi:hypothetical protein
MTMANRQVICDNKNDVSRLLNISDFQTNKLSTMKKLIACLVAIGLVSTLYAQNIFNALSDEGGKASYSGSRTITCPPGSIYSHQVNYDNGLSSQEDLFFYWDRIETAPGAPISQVVFYGVAMGTPHRNFTINFYHDDGGVPGTMKASYTGFITGESTGEILFNMEAFSYTYTLPASLTIDAGDWISIIAANVPGELWYWLTAYGGDGCVWVNYLGEMCEFNDLAFCLVGGLGSEVPVAPWALAMGIALIAVAAILHSRRISLPS